MQRVLRDPLLDSSCGYRGDAETHLQMDPGDVQRDVAHHQQHQGRNEEFYHQELGSSCQSEVNLRGCCACVSRSGDWQKMDSEDKLQVARCTEGKVPRARKAGCKGDSVQGIRMVDDDDEL